MVKQISMLYEESESVNRRRTDSTMVKRKRTKGQTTIYKTYKTKDRVTRTPLNTGGELRCSGRVSSSCSTNDTRRVNLVVTNPEYIYRSFELVLKGRPYHFKYNGKTILNGFEKKKKTKLEKTCFQI